MVAPIISPSIIQSSTRENAGVVYAERLRSLARAGRAWFADARAVQEYGEANNLVAGVMQMPDTIEVDGNPVSNMVPGTDLSVADAKRLFAVFGAVMTLLQTPLEATGESPAVTLNRAI